MKYLIAFLLLIAGVQSAEAQRGLHIIVSTSEGWLWLMRDNEVVISVPAAVGSNSGFSHAGREFFFRTPHGRRTVQAKAVAPDWRPPDWHYYEVAAEERLPLVHMRAGRPVPLSDGTTMVVRGDQVGRLTEYGQFIPWPPEVEMIHDGKVFVPPPGTRQRSIPGILGPYALRIGDGYMIHGVHEYNSDSVGRPVSHGCIRVDNETIRELYRLVPVGAPVIIR